MSQIRKAHTVEIIERRLRDCEAQGNLDAMELISIHDELARVERKWLAKQSGALGPKGSTRSRPLSDAAQMNARFERLTRLVEASLRKATPEPATVPLLRRTADLLRARRPLPSPDSKEVPGTRTDSK